MVGKVCWVCGIFEVGGGGGVSWGAGCMYLMFFFGFFF